MRIIPQAVVAALRAADHTTRQLFGVGNGRRDFGVQWASLQHLDLPGQPL